MYSRIEDFVNAYTHESQATGRVLGALNDQCLSQEKEPGDPTWNIGKLGWHIATTPYWIVNEFGGQIPGSEEPAQLSAAAITAEQARVSAATIEQVKAKFSDADTAGTVSAFGYPLPLGAWLHALVAHEVHHRGQLSVMMRQAGVACPSLYGPNKEETARLMAEGMVPADQ